MAQVNFDLQSKTKR